MDRLGTIHWLWGFQAWARSRLLDTASRLPTERLNEPGTIAGGLGTGSLHDMLAHIVGAEEVWLRRWQGEERVPLPAWGTSPIWARSPSGGRRSRSAGPDTSMACPTRTWVATCGT
jgi:uncharacterized damage-inducible protein DinB